MHNAAVLDVCELWWSSLKELLLWRLPWLCGCGNPNSMCTHTCHPFVSLTLGKPQHWITAAPTPIAATHSCSAVLQWLARSVGCRVAELWCLQQFLGFQGHASPAQVQPASKPKGMNTLPPSYSDCSSSAGRDWMCHPCKAAMSKVWEGQTSTWCIPVPDPRQLSPRLQLL